MNSLQWSKLIFLGKKKEKKIANTILLRVFSKELPKVSYNFQPAVTFLSLVEISHRGIKAYGTKTGDLVIPGKVFP